MFQEIIAGTTLGDEARKALMVFDVPILKTEICQRVALCEAGIVGQTIHEYAPGSQAGGFKGIRVYKFRLFDQQILLACQVNEDKKEVIFAAVGGHENFYRDLKQYLDN